MRLPDYLRAYRARIRDPDWNPTLDLFRFHSDGIAAIQRLSKVWIENYGLRRVNVYSGRIVNEIWTADRIGRLVDQMARIPHSSGLRNSMRTSEPPRYTQFPLVVVRTQGREFFIDGRRRANVWRHQAGPYDVRVIDVG